MGTRIYDYDMDNYVDMPGHELRNSWSYAPGQATGTTIDGKLTVTDRDYTNLLWAGMLRDLEHDQFYDLMEFYKDTIKWSLYLFWVRVPNQRTSSTEWNQRNIPWRCDYEIDGSCITCDQSINGSTAVCDMRVPADYEFIGPLRLDAGGFKFTEYPDSIFAVSLKATQEHYD